MRSIAKAEAGVGCFHGVVARGYPHPSGLRPATLPTRARDEQQRIIYTLSNITPPNASLRHVMCYAPLRHNARI
jgi:hypothetical protein